MKFTHLSVLIFLLFCLPGVSIGEQPPQRIISLAPHLTEWIYSLDAEEQLVGVSEFSDYPAAASKKPRVASHHGVDFEAIMQLSPDLILAWQGGNKPQDLARLESLGYALFYSNPKQLKDISRELRQLGKQLGREQQAVRITDKFENELRDLRNQYRQRPRQKVFYYLWTTPLMTIGKGAWANEALRVCNLQNVFRDSPTPYPEVTLEQVVRQQPQLLIAALDSELAAQQAYWQPYLPLLNAPVRVVDPNHLHRFTPRIIEGLTTLCDKVI